jgi:hypothetical protein
MVSTQHGTCGWASTARISHGRHVQDRVAVGTHSYSVPDGMARAASDRTRPSVPNLSGSTKRKSRQIASVIPSFALDRPDNKIYLEVPSSVASQDGSQTSLPATAAVRPGELPESYVLPVQYQKCSTAPLRLSDTIANLEQHTRSTIRAQPAKNCQAATPRLLSVHHDDTTNITASALQFGEA